MKSASKNTDNKRGLTLVELIVALTITALVAVAGAALTRALLNVHTAGNARMTLLRDATQIMSELTRNVRTTAHVAVPNARQPSASYLVIALGENNDMDYYFEDDRFPRVDEDPGADLQGGGLPGVKGVDDDGDGVADEGGVALAGDDDEDGNIDEDPLDGVDNDGDGDLDEDTPADRNGDGRAGLAGMDDNGDGNIDKGGASGAADDDDDGMVDEDGLEYVVYKATPDGAITMQDPAGESSVLAIDVESFSSTWMAPDLIRITLSMRSEQGGSVTLSEVVSPRNVAQETGKRVH